MDSKNCEYRRINNECFYGRKKKDEVDKIHIGTENKLKFIETYTNSWAQKVLLKQNPFESVVFVDAMCSSGKFINQKFEKIDGTSLRVYDSFLKMASSDNLKNKRFHLVINDYNNQAIICQKCRLSEKDSRSNVDLKVLNLDVKDFLNERNNYLPLKERFHLLFYYDPYIVEVCWDEISKFLNSNIDINGRKIQYDLIITHFHQNDISRNIEKKVSNDVRTRYETSYQETLESIRTLIRNGNDIENRMVFRNLFKKALSKKLCVDINKVVYAPIFNKQNRDVYDVVFYSENDVARQLFKETMYREMKRRNNGKDTFDQNTLDVHENSEEKYSYTIDCFKEIEYYYSASSYANIIAKNFSEKTISNDELNNFIRRHDFIPLNSAKTEIDLKLKVIYKVTIKSKPKKFYIFGKYNGES